MPITKITIENFKGIGGKVEIPLRPITLLFGANSVGKSTILQAMLYLRELLERRDAKIDRLSASGGSIDLGGFRQIVHQHDLGRIIRIGVTVELDDDGLPSYPMNMPWERNASGASPVEPDGLADVGTVGICLGIAWDDVLNEPFINENTIELNGDPLIAIKQPPGLFEFSCITAFNTTHPLFQSGQESPDSSEDLSDNDGKNETYRYLLSGIAGVTGGNVFADVEGPDRLGEGVMFNEGYSVLPEWGKAFPLSADDEPPDINDALIGAFLFSQITVGSGESVLNELRNIRYLGPLRRIPRRNFSPVQSAAEDRWVDGAAAWDLLFASHPDWLKAETISTLNLGYTFEYQKYYEIPADGAVAAFLIRPQLGDEIMLGELESREIKQEISELRERGRLRVIDENLGVEVDLCDVGVGVSQVLPVVIGAMAPGYSVFSVEQPELHIHPAVQCALADVLAHQVGGESEHSLLLETHSEHLMLRLLRRIRETSEDELSPGAPSLTPADVSVLYVENTEDGQKITELPITEDGDFSRQWPKGFFEERAEELF